MAVDMLDRRTGNLTFIVNFCFVQVKYRKWKSNLFPHIFKTIYLFEKMDEQQKYFCKMSLRNFILQLKPKNVSDASRKMQRIST